MAYISICKVHLIFQPIVHFGNEEISPVEHLHFYIVLYPSILTSEPILHLLSEEVHPYLNEQTCQSTDI